MRQEAGVTAMTKFHEGGEERGASRKRPGQKEKTKERRPSEKSQTDNVDERQFARVVKGVDLRSTGGNSAWVRTPQLTCFAIAWKA